MSDTSNSPDISLGSKISRRIDNFAFSILFCSIIENIGETVLWKSSKSSFGGNKTEVFLKSVLLNFGWAEPPFMPWIISCP